MKYVNVKMLGVQRLCKVQYLRFLVALQSAKETFTNLICTDLRSNLTVNDISNVMTIKANGSPIQLFKPDCYTESWLLHHRPADDIRSRTVVLQLQENNTLWTTFNRHSASTNNLLLRLQVNCQVGHIFNCSNCSSYCIGVYSSD